MNELRERGKFHDAWQGEPAGLVMVAGKRGFMRFISFIAVQLAFDAIGDRGDEFHRHQAFSEADAEGVVFW